MLSVLTQNLHNYPKNNDLETLSILQSWQINDVPYCPMSNAGALRTCYT